MPQFLIRPAVKADALAIAKLFLISSDGLAAHIWSKSVQPDEALEAVGARRYAREGVDFSFENCLIAESDGELAGMLHSFAMHEAPNGAPAAEPEADPVLMPYLELEDYGSFYVSGLAVVEKFRGLGLGTQLMAEAETRARALGLPRVSLICFERNEGAQRLYKRLGYRALMRRAVVPHPMLRYGDGDAVLLAKEI